MSVLNVPVWDGFCAGHTVFGGPKDWWLHEEDDDINFVTLKEMMKHTGEESELALVLVLDDFHCDVTGNVADGFRADMWSIDDMASIIHDNPDDVVDWVMEMLGETHDTAEGRIDMVGHH